MYTKLCEWKCTYTVLMLTIKQVIYESMLNDNTKDQNRKKIIQGSLKFTHFAGKFSRGPQFQERAAGVTLLSIRIHPKKYCIFPKNVAPTFLSGSRKGTVGA